MYGTANQHECFFAFCWQMCPVQRLSSNWELSAESHMPPSAVQVRLWVYWWTTDTGMHACNISHPNQILAMFASQKELKERYESHVVEDIFRGIREENTNMNMNFTAEIYNEALIMIEDLCLEIANRVLSQLGMPSPNRSAVVSNDIILRPRQTYNTGDVVSYVQSNIPQLAVEE